MRSLSKKKGSEIVSDGQSWANEVQKQDEVEDLKFSLRDLVKFKTPKGEEKCGEIVGYEDGRRLTEFECMRQGLRIPQGIVQGWMYHLKIEGDTYRNLLPEGELSRV